MGKVKHTIEQIKEIFEKQECKLLETTYVSCRQKLKFQCRCGTIRNIDFVHFNQRKPFRCRECYLGPKRKKYDEVYNFFKSQKCELLDKTLPGNKTPLKYICKCGTVSAITWNNFARGHRCRRCGSNKPPDQNTVLKYFLQCGFALLEKYTMHDTRMKCKCTTCNTESKKSLADLRRNRKCYQCYRRNNDKRSTNIKEWKLSQFARKCYNVLMRTLQITDQAKTDITKTMLGYSPTDLQNHIKTHPNWTNCKNTEWHLDHIFPIKAFIDHNIKDIKLINCLENLQPLLPEDNLLKADKYDQESFLDWLIQTK